MEFGILLARLGNFPAASDTAGDPPRNKATDSRTPPWSRRIRKKNFRRWIAWFTP